MGLEQRTLSKVLVSQDGALQLLKLSHNGVRAVNRFLLTSLVDRWIDRDVMRGNWTDDKVRFGTAWRAFVVAGEDAFNGNVHAAYLPVRRVVAKRREAIAAKA